jgi:hypothetical protein
MIFNTDLMICPCCKTYMNKAKPVNGVCAPTDGDFSICANCAAILVYVINENNTSFRKALDEDLIIAKKQDIYTYLIDAQNYILSGDHGLRNMTKEEMNSEYQKDNW